MILTAENYYSQEANRTYFSASQIKALMDCESRAAAELNGDYEREPSTALLVGGYVDAYFSGEIGEYAACHPEILTRKGELRADFLKAEEIIARIERDDLAKRMLSGEKQRILTGMIFGVPFKAKMDCLLSQQNVASIYESYPDMTELMYAGGAIVDLKIMKDFEPKYRDGAGRLNFIEYWRYDVQMAIYQELMRQQCDERLPCYILAATKEKNPNIGLFQVPQALMDADMEILSERMPHFSAVKEGKESPCECGLCDWCRQSKVLTCATWLEEWA